MTGVQAMTRRPTVGSLFSGAGGFDIGFDRAGFALAWQVEINKTARSVLARHWPGVPRHEDVRAVGKHNLAPVDVLVGGFPCQDLSTAGKRAGFAGGERSSLFFEMARVIDELRPSYVCWENVPGLMSSADGRDFLAVLVELDRLGFDGGWRTVDAQYFGVPQQRRRVFGVFARRDLGADRAAEILALTEGVRRRTPSRRKKGAGVAATLTSGTSGRGVNPPGRRQEDDTNLVVEAPFTFDWQAGGGGDDTSFRGKSRQWVCDKPGIARSLVANKCLAVFGGGDTSGERGVAATLTAKPGNRQDFDTENFVLIQDARDVDKAQNGAGVKVGGPAYTLDSLGTQAVCVGCLAPDATPKGNNGDLAYALTSRQERGHGNGMAVGVTGTVTHTLTNEGHDASEDGTGRGTPVVTTGATVRRLTPRECERLMGWPDDHTRYAADGKELSDGPRYRLCGNGVVGSVAEWIARRLMAVGFGVRP